MISYRHELSQTGTARGGRHSLVVSSALARELERDIEDHRRQVYLERSGTTAPKRVWHPALYKTQDVILNFVHSPLKSVELFMRELDQYRPAKKRRSMTAGIAQQLKFLFKTRY
ncbi:uncharacterized protein LOC111269395 isoform X1 [Varroa jacobsoni]|uniref:Uncharacterized protein n=1 Tax=Varroa destructor TaxID=109461 RepID=A0A7M7KHC2_VARDE|nr:uncharacterized protein LOC111250305 [Varroa destructor]XP_022704687.1 uncharacterized protein LOC111269395 isoform X1 [Varroa jacobsoni]